MKKYRLTFDHPVKAQEAWCAAVMDHKCGACPLAKIKPDGRSCGMFALHHLDKAAALMGLEIVKENEDEKI